MVFPHKLGLGIIANCEDAVGSKLCFPRKERKIDKCETHVKQNVLLSAPPYTDVNLLTLALLGEGWSVPTFACFSWFVLCHPCCRSGPKSLLAQLGRNILGRLNTRDTPKTHQRRAWRQCQQVTWQEISHSLFFFCWLLLIWWFFCCLLHFLSQLRDSLFTLFLFETTCLDHLFAILSLQTLLFFGLPVLLCLR